MNKNQIKRFWIFALVLFCLSTSVYSNTKDTKVLVVRGGHPYDTPEFENMCSTLKDIKADLVLTAHFESMKSAEIEKNYDAILFLNQNKHYPEYEKNKKKYMELADKGMGMVFLHFTLSSQPTWDGYHDLVGGKWFLKSHTKDKDLLSTYFIDLTVDIKVLDKNHPVTQGLKDFTMTDTFYGNIKTDPSIHPLLGSNNPDLAPAIAWAHKYKNSKVVYIMPGFSKKAYENASYKKLVSNALNYVGSLAY